MTRRLLVTADDFGLTEGVSTAILTAHRHGIVTGTSALAVAPGFERAGRWLADEPDLDVGVHLALTGEDPPTLTAAEVPTLVDRAGRFPPSWRQLMARLHGVDPDDLARELRAQIERVAATGATLTHLDSHQHVHLLKPVAEVVVALALEHGLGVIRVPRSARRTPTGVAVRTLARGLARSVAGAGLWTTEAFIGLDGAGRLGRAQLSATLQAVAAGPAESVELNVHPGPSEDPDRHRYRWGYRWGAELDALTDPSIPELLARLGFRLARRHDLHS